VSSIPLAYASLGGYKPFNFGMAFPVFLRSRISISHLRFLITAHQAKSVNQQHVVNNKKMHFFYQSHSNAARLYKETALRREKFPAR
jgi:hypothetical protein